MRKLTQEEFVAKAREVHGEKYDYSKAKYVNNRTKVCVICPEHGEFWQVPYSHLNSYGCPKCAAIVRNSKITKSTLDFVGRAKSIHGEKYDYSKADYKAALERVCIICPVHGEFWQRAADHMSGCGCPKCAKISVANKQRRTLLDFVSIARAVHGDKYDYSRANYVDSQTCICIICPEHGEFWQRPNNHLLGQGCPKCGKELRKNLICGVGINDVSENVKDSPISMCYETWDNMIKRCYDKNADKKSPTYKDCTVSDEWHYFSAFLEWYNQHYIERWHLDKDILIKGNKEYGPKTCCFVPREINNLFLRRQRFRGLLPIGVTFTCKRFRATINMGKRVSIGTFNTPEEAFQAYKVAKEAWIKELADKWRDQLEPRVYEALYNYKVEITD